MSIFSDIQTRSFSEDAADWLGAYMGGWLIGAGFFWPGIAVALLGMFISVGLYHRRLSHDL